MQRIRHSAYSEAETSSSELQIEVTNRTMNIKLILLLPFVLVGFSIKTCLAQQPPRPIKVYLLGVDSDLKGEFAQVGPELTVALQTAFSSQPGAFMLLDRTNLDALVKANQLEGDLNAVVRGDATATRLDQMAYATFTIA